MVVEVVLVATSVVDVVLVVDVLLVDVVLLVVVGGWVVVVDVVVVLVVVVEQGSGVTVQLDVPLQLRVAHWSLVQVMPVPMQAPPPVHWSLYVQAFPSLHAVPSDRAGFEQTPVDGSHDPGA